MVKAFGFSTYGPIEFFMTVLAMDMVAPKFGKHDLESYFNEVEAISQFNK
jgi:hypothetical protein